jgi:hypothetical protein
MKAIWAVMDTASAAQDIRVQAYFQQYLRYDIGDVMSTLARPIPTTSLEVHNSHVRAGEVHGAVLREIPPPTSMGGFVSLYG